jgi:hypothetical protein
LPIAYDGKIMQFHLKSAPIIAQFLIAPIILFYYRR